MGHVFQEVRLWAAKIATVRMLADTGATFSVIPPGLARILGIRRPRRSARVRLADGRKVRSGADADILRIDRPDAPTTILVGKVDQPILGVEALEPLGLAFDQKKKRLSPSRTYGVRLGGNR